MASKLILDRSDPGVDELVSSWKDGGTYTCEVEITQVKSGPNTAEYDLTAISDTGAPAAPKPASKKAKAPAEVEVEY